MMRVPIQLHAVRALRAPVAPRRAPVLARASGQKPLMVRAVAENSTADVPLPTIKIDNTSDPFATIVKVDFGDRLGELLDTIQALKNLGFNIKRAKLSEDSKNKFFITDSQTAEKVTKSARLEDIRQCILSNLKLYHPESSSMISSSYAEISRSPLSPLGASKQVVSNTFLAMEEVDGRPFTKLMVTTTDRPGLLVDIVRTLKDCNINVVSAEVDTIGPKAQDEFLLCYHGEPLSKPMQTLVKNALQYYLALHEVETDESY